MDEEGKNKGRNRRGGAERQRRAVTGLLWGSGQSPGSNSISHSCTAERNIQEADFAGLPRGREALGDQFKLAQLRRDRVHKPKSGPATLWDGGGVLTFLMPDLLLSASKSARDRTSRLHQCVPPLVTRIPGHQHNQHKS